MEIDKMERMIAYKMDRKITYKTNDNIQQQKEMTKSIFINDYLWWGNLWIKDIDLITLKKEWRKWKTRINRAFFLKKKMWRCWMITKILETLARFQMYILQISQVMYALGICILRQESCRHRESLLKEREMFQKQCLQQTYSIPLSKSSPSPKIALWIQAYDNKAHRWRRIKEPFQTLGILK